MSLAAAADSALYRQTRRLGLQALAWLVDLVFPPTCANCSRVDARFCAACRAQLARHPLKMSQHRADRLDGLCSTGGHQDVLASAVRALKYQGATDLSGLLAQRLILALSAQNWRIDAAIPVPLHADRLLKRGYNQAELLGERAAQAHGIRLDPGLLRRTRNTSQQARLSGEERLQNVSGAFEASPAAQGLSILLIDDVVTTGATLIECAAALRARKATAVYGVAICHA